MQTKFENTDDFLNSEEYNRYVLGQSGRLQKKWDTFFKAHPEKKADARRARKIIKGLAEMKDTTADSEISEFQLYHNFEKTWKEYKYSQSNTWMRGATVFMRRALVVAAVVIFAVVVYTLLNKFIISSKPENVFYSEIYVPPARQSQLTLPDGSKVWVNADSRLKYSNHFNADERDIYLQGEAYFEVTKNTEIPFRVISGEVEVRVAGTKFSMRAYPEENRVEAVLAEGRIEFFTNQETSEKSYQLKPGDKVIYNLDNNLVLLSEQNITRELAWKDGQLVFTNAPLFDVCRSLQRWYGIEIEITGDTLGLHPFTFTVEQETIEQILEYLTRAAPLEFKKMKVENTESGEVKTKYTIYATK